MSILIALCVLILAHSRARAPGFLQLPALIAVLYLAWFIPQLFSLSQDFSVPATGYNRLVAMMMLCLMATWLGWNLRTSEKQTTIEADYSKLILPAILLTLLSVGVNLLLTRYRADYIGVQQWSGAITIIAFFAQIRDVALAVSLLLFLQHRNRLTFVIMATNLLVTLPVAFVLLRRTEMIGLLTAVMWAYWFARRKSVSLAILIPIGVALTVVVYAIGPLRHASSQFELATGERLAIFDPTIWSHIDIGAAIAQSANLAFDLRNALFLIDYAAESGYFNFGASLWNSFVKLYIPAQLLGAEFKASLQFSLGPDAYESISNIYNFDYRTGTTSTGFGSTFRDFGFLGPLYFFIMGYIMKIMFIYGKAGYFWAQVAYVCFIPQVLLSFTHGHGRFFVAIPFLASVILCLRAASQYHYRYGRLSSRSSPNRRKTNP